MTTKARELCFCLGIGLGHYATETPCEAKSRVAQKKLPLMFFTNLTNGEVHTIRYDDEAKGPFYTTCGLYAQVQEGIGEVDREPSQITCDKCLALYTERFKWTIEVTIHPSWVADGANLTEDRAFDMVCSEFPFANSNELEVKVLSAPDADEVAMEQGYRDAAHMNGDK